VTEQDFENRSEREKIQAKAHFQRGAQKKEGKKGRRRKSKSSSGFKKEKFQLGRWRSIKEEGAL